MRINGVWVLGVVLALVCVSAGADPLKIAVVTGGHGFSEKPFFEMFGSMEGIEYTHVALKDNSEIFEDISAWPYDVIVLYNMTQKISEKRRGNFLKLMDKGVGLVVLHHAIAAFSEWPEFRKISGVRYYLKDTEENGVKHARCTWKEGVDFPIHIEDTDHPVTRGIKDFVVHDEVYKGSSFEPDNHVLLTTTDPLSDKTIGWVRTYANSNVCFIQIGHGDSIFADPNYRQLIGQAIKWAAEGKKAG